MWELSPVVVKSHAGVITTLVGILFTALAPELSNRPRLHGRPMKPEHGQAGRGGREKERRVDNREG